MSFNPDDAGKDDNDSIINNLRQENACLKVQIDELSCRLARYTISSATSASASNASNASDTAVASSIPGVSFNATTTSIEGTISSRVLSQSLGTTTRSNNTAAAVVAVPARRENNSRGRKSIPFDYRSEKQHQGRIVYLLKLLEKGSEQVWNQELIADLQAYCISNSDFFRQALEAYGVGQSEAAGSEDIDIDTFIAMLQSH
jgi:hypothetical protein